jgi:class 3 adenylate cyclase
MLAEERTHQRLGSILITMFALGASALRSGQEHLHRASGTVTNLSRSTVWRGKGGQILVPQRVCAAVEELAEMEPVGELSLKGFTKPLPAFNVVALREAESTVPGERKHAHGG